MTVTIKDVAKKLGISYSSVSRALNGKPGVSGATRSQIQKAAEEMGYQPNFLARSLVNRTTKTIGVIVPDISNPFFCAIVTGITEAAAEKKYDVLLCVSNWDIAKEMEYITTLKNKQVDGLILKPSSDKEKDLYNDIELPLLFLESWFSGSGGSIVEVDNKKGGYLAAEHLIQCGYKHIGIICGRVGSFSSSQRLEGYSSALQEYGLKVKDSLISKGNPFTVSGGFKATEKLLKNNKNLDAIFAANDMMALGAMQLLNEKGILVPDQMGIIGFDDITYAALPQIMLSTINQPKEEMGKIAFTTLYEHIKNKDSNLSKRIVLQPRLAIRKTTCNINLTGGK